MPKRRLDITGNTKRKRNAIAQRQRRERQNVEEVETLRMANAERNRRRREEESEVDTNRRRLVDAEHHRNLRDEETEENADFRRSQDAERHRNLRDEETEENADFRRSQDAERHRNLRDEETEENAELRRIQNAERNRSFRAEENEENADFRKSQDAERHRNLRDEETEENASRRRTNDSKRHREVRSHETIHVRESRLRSNRKRRTISSYHNAGRSGLVVDTEQHYCGHMDGCCHFCKGLFFQDEKNSRGRYMHCCHNGKIFENERAYPEELRDLMNGNHLHSDDFFKNIRNYNSALSFASMGANIEMPQGSGPYCFRIHGSIYHQTSHLHPPEQGEEKYAQLYILDSDQALRQRMRIKENTSLNSDLLKLLDSIIRKINPYAQAYKMLKEFEEETLREQGTEAASDIRMYIKDKNVATGEHRGRYNAPQGNEVALIFKSEDGIPPSNRDIVIHLRGGGLVHISTLNPNLEPMTYVLFFPHGDKGFSVGQQYTELQFYSYRVSVRRDYFNAILFGRKLFQQYLVDAYVKVEGNRLSYLKSHQKDLRVETYMGLADHIYSVGKEINITPGIPVILPSSFIGSPRSMHQNYQDSIAIVRDFGKPDLFLTFTCNPKWPEITENLYQGQKSHDRSDIVSRVYDLKKTALLEDITKNHILGVTIAHIHVIEFQKRGLPHLHLLLFLSEDDKPKDSETIDSLVCAELPDASLDPMLHNIIRTSMIHGPCGELNKNSPCMIDNVCSKGYPKPFQKDTIQNVGGYPLYRRRDDGNFITIKDNIIDNRWVVPYNPYLTKKYNAHINVEVCSSIKSVKYLFKYVYKGHDAAQVILDQSGETSLAWDEIKSFLNARYVSAPEATWRLFEKRMHAKSHAVIRLPVHLENLQPVFFAQTEETEALKRASEKKTMLTGWFHLNETSPEANCFLYEEIPKHFTWQNNTWNKRMKFQDRIISRMYSVSPKDFERFYLRLLLCHVKGAKSFSDLRTYEGIEYATFKEACQARDLLQNDQEWRNCLAEASTSKMPSQLRQLFSFICAFCNPADPLALWIEFQQALSEDFSRSYSSEDSSNLALKNIEDLLQVHSISLTDLGLPQSTISTAGTQSAPIYDVQVERQQAEEMKELLNNEQRLVYDTVLESVEEENHFHPKMFFLNAFAGSGKTFLFKAILHAVRGKGYIAVAVAWSGIAATLLPGGRTVHSTFKLPVPVLENSSCYVRQDSAVGKHLKAAKLFIWDECTMTPHHALDWLVGCLCFV